MYKVIKSAYFNRYMVISEATGVSQSSWEDVREANNVARDLNARAAIFTIKKLVAVPKRPELRLVKS